MRGEGKINQIVFVGLGVSVPDKKTEKKRQRKRKKDKGKGKTKVNNKLERPRQGQEKKRIAQFGRGKPEVLLSRTTTSAVVGFAEASLQARKDRASTFNDAFASVHHSIGSLFSLSKLD